MRQGVGKVRHLHVKLLWIQEAVAAGELVVVKIPRAENCSDALTHAWTAADLVFWSEMGLRFNTNPHLQEFSSSSSSRTQGPALYLLYLEAAETSPRDMTSYLPSPSTTTTTPKGPQWPVAKRKGKFLGAGTRPARDAGAGVAQRKEKFLGAGTPPARDAGKGHRLRPKDRLGPKDRLRPKECEPIMGRLADGGICA